MGLPNSFSPFLTLCLILVGLLHHQNLAQGSLAGNIGDVTQEKCVGGSSYIIKDVNDTVHNKCWAFYQSYVDHAGQFAECELKFSRPFRMCNACVVEYEKASSIYNDFITSSDLEDCRTSYLKADRVQIAPTMQNQMKTIWTSAACAACTQDVEMNPCTGEVTFSIPDHILGFMDVFHNLSVCLNVSLEDLTINPLAFNVKNKSKPLCRTCNADYMLLNAQYDSISNLVNGDICMDVVDRMNHTRLVWSHIFGCNCRKGDSTPVIIIAIVVGITPLLFYGILRYKGKEKRSKVFKQKRLAAARSSSTISPLSQSLNANSNIPTTSGSSGHSNSL